MICRNISVLSIILLMVSTATSVCEAGQALEEDFQSRKRLVAWWKFDNDANDSAGANHGTPQGDPTYEVGKFGQAISLDGDDYVDLGNSEVLNFGKGYWAVSAWMKTTQTGTGDANKGTIFANGGDEVGGKRYTMAINEGPGGVLTLTTDDDIHEKVRITGETRVNDGVWHHIVGMRHANQLHLYIDGVLNGISLLYDDYDLSGVSQHNAYIGVIANNRDNSLYKRFVGQIDEVCVFACALDADSVRALYSGEDPFIVAEEAKAIREPQAQPIKPTMQGEYIRPGLSQDWHVLFDESQQSIAEIMTEDKIPGLSIALVDREDLVWTAGFGYTDYDLKTPVTPDTIFSIQSMSKTLTTTLVMFAVQEGLVDLDTPISEYLSDFKVKSRFEENPQDKITLRHLCSHTAGFVHEAPVGNNYERKSPSFEAHIQSISDTWLRFPVGAKYSYSNLGIDLAAYILQIRSGRSFAEYMRYKLFDPLDMSNSFVDIEFIRQHPNRAIGHTPHIEKETLEIPMIGAGGVYTSARDLAKFVQFHLNAGEVGGNRILSKKDVESLFRPGASFCIAIRFLAKGIPQDAFSVDPNATDGTYMLGLSGGGFGFLCTMSWFPEYGMGLLVLTNSRNHDYQNYHIPNKLADRILSKKLVKRIDPAPYSPWKALLAENNEPPTYQAPDPDTFTRYKPEWKKYTGRYKYIADWNLCTYALGDLGLVYPELRAKVYEKNGYLRIDGKRLDEYRPGVFFTKDGDCLDFTGPTPLWRGRRIKKK
jgi:CubicO group peptidase (beta-lactamase class C family)